MLADEKFYNVEVLVKVQTFPEKLDYRKVKSTRDEPYRFTRADAEKYVDTQQRAYGAWRGQYRIVEAKGA